MGNKPYTEDPDYRRTNREDSMRAKKKDKYWCMACDGALVGDVGRCPNCGVYAYRKKRKGM